MIPALPCGTYSDGDTPAGAFYVAAFEDGDTPHHVGEYRIETVLRALRALQACGYDDVEIGSIERDGKTHLLLIGLSARQPEIVRPQTSGPCVHYDERSEHAADAYPCTYPYGDEHSDGVCPHLDNPDVLCPVKDACYAMRDITRRREACEAEQDEQDADMAAVAPSQTYETAAPEFVEPEPDDGVLHTYTVPATRKPTNPNAWSDEEIEVIRRAQSAAEAGRLYVDAFPESNRTAAAVSSRWYKLRAAGELIELRPGARVRIKHALHRGQTGKIERYFPATENYLVAIDGMPDMIVLTDAQMEAV